MLIRENIFLKIHSVQISSSFKQVLISCFYSLCSPPVMTLGKIWTLLVMFETPHALKSFTKHSKRHTAWTYCIAEWHRHSVTLCTLNSRQVSSKTHKETTWLLWSKLLVVIIWSDAITKHCTCSTVSMQQVYFRVRTASFGCVQTCLQHCEFN